MFDPCPGPEQQNDLYESQKAPVRTALGSCSPVIRVGVGNETVYPVYTASHRVPGWMLSIHPMTWYGYPAGCERRKIRYAEISMQPRDDGRGENYSRLNPATSQVSIVVSWREAVTFSKLGSWKQEDIMLPEATETTKLEFHRTPDRAN